jgi:uncharacterized protein (DUF58 family)
MADPRIEMRRWHDWTDPDFFMQGRQAEKQLLPLFMRQIVPQQFQRSKLTLSGWMLVIVALGIGSAAYNTSSNILFMTLSLILSSLVLSGVLSWINFRCLTWRLHAPEHLQVGELGVTEVVLENAKRIFPSMSLVFRLSCSLVGVSRRLYLKEAISAGAASSLEWTITPTERGPLELRLEGVESKFPFGFLLKTVGESVSETVLVWPARKDYSFAPLANGYRFRTGVSRRKAGSGSDLLNLRQYERGDPPRLIHWRATARMNKLMIRQLAQEGESGYRVWVSLHCGWEEAQFESLCSVVCALTEDLFHVGRLDAVCLAGREPIAVRGLRELHEFFDQLAALVFRDLIQREEPLPELGWSNMVHFKPRGEGEVVIYVDGTQAGEA